MLVSFHDGISNISKAIPLRDYFAAAALQGLIAAPETDADAEEYAELSYVMADAMLKAGGYV